MHSNYNTDDLRISGMTQVIAPVEVHTEMPITNQAAQTIFNTRQAIHNILTGEDDRLVVVVGPCSIHDTKAAHEYGMLLKEAIAQFSDELLIVMRVYFEKPRTTVGWKGLINDPDLDSSFNINKGIKKIVLPVDHTPESCQKLAFTAKLAEYFNSEIYVLALYSNNLKTINRKVDENAHTVSQFLIQKEIKHTVESVFTDDVTKTTLNFVEIVNADLLSIMTEQEISKVNILIGPSAQQFINQSSIPVLSLKPAELYEKYK